MEDEFGKSISEAVLEMSFHVGAVDLELQFDSGSSDFVDSLKQMMKEKNSARAHFSAEPLPPNM